MASPAGTSNGLPPLTDFEKQKWLTNDYFAYYRRGLDDDVALNNPFAKWTMAAVYADYHLAPDPRLRMPGPPRGRWDDIYRLQAVSGSDGEAKVSDIRRFDPPAATNATPASDPMRGQEVDVARVQGSSVVKGVPFTVKRVLGKGSFGLALLCESEEPSLRARARRRFCLKFDLRGAGGRCYFDVLAVFLNILEGLLGASRALGMGGIATMHQRAGHYCDISDDARRSSFLTLRC